MAIKAISFDFWYTLFTEAPMGFEKYSQRKRRILTDAVLTEREVVHTELDRACKIESEFHNQIWQEEHRTLPATERVAAILKALEVTLKLEVFTGLVRSLEEGLLEHPPLLIEGAGEIIPELSKRYRLGIISDVGFSPGRVLKQVLCENGLLDKFDSLVFSDEAGRAKPHREVFEATARLLNVEPHEIVHIGDLERTDIIGAKRAGFRAIRFTGITPMEESETSIADFVTDDLREVPRLVESLN